MTCSNQASDPSCRLGQASLTSVACRRRSGFSSKPTGQLCDDGFHISFETNFIIIHILRVQPPCKLARHVVHQKAILPFDDQLQTHLYGQICAQMAIPEVCNAQATLPVQQLHGSSQAISTARSQRVHKQPGGAMLRRSGIGRCSVAVLIYKCSFYNNKNNSPHTQTSHRSSLHSDCRSRTICQPVRHRVAVSNARTSPQPSSRQCAVANRSGKGRAAAADRHVVFR